MAVPKANSHDALSSVQFAVDILTECTENKRKRFFNLRQHLAACWLMTSRKAATPSPKETLLLSPEQSFSQFA